jgi:cobalt-zinc-cadmium efflux system outer membrane protein
LEEFLVLRKLLQPVSAATLAAFLLAGTAFAASDDDSPLKTIQNAIKEQRQIQQQKKRQEQPEATPNSKNASPTEPVEILKAMTLEQALWAATLRNPEFKALQAKLGISSAEIITAGARLNPALMTDNGVAEKTYRLGVEHTLELGGKRRRRVELAQAQRDVLLAEINTQLLNLRANVRQAYTRLYNAQERQRTYQNILQVAQELVDIARKRERAGDISKLDALQAEIVSVNANNDLQLAVSEVVNAQNELNALLYQPLTSELTLAPPSTTPQLDAVPPAEARADGGAVLHGRVKEVALDLNQLIETALTRRPEIEQNLRNLKVADRQLALARANRTPNLTISAGGDFVTGSGQNATGIFAIGRMELPLLNRQQGPIGEALARKAQLEQEQAALKNSITLEVSKAYTAYLANQERVKRYETQLLPYSVAVVEKSRRAFEEGKADILMAINAQQAYMNTRLGYLQAMMDYQNAISLLERAIGAGL